MGREAFIERVWEWKEKSGGVIIEQLKRLGASCDWTRERFTMDEGLSRAVREVFVRLFEEGLIYRGDYIINWCPRCKTALSDVEVEHEETKGHLYYIKYPFADGSGSVTVATTRPETMLGDTAVAVNPEDERYARLIGKELVLPLTGQEDTPYRRPLRRHGFRDGRAQDNAGPRLQRLRDRKEAQPPGDQGDRRRRQDERAGGQLQGMDRFAARERIVEDLRPRACWKRSKTTRLSSEGATGARL